MKRVYFQESWPDSWKSSYFYDLEEIYGEVTQPGYAESYRQRRKETLRLIEEVMPKGARILDIGSAQGNFPLTLAEAGYRATWSDIRTELADYVKLKYEFGEIDYAPGNAFDLSFPEPFDCVVISEIIEHVAHPDRFLQKAAQLIRPGGNIVMTTPNGAYFRNKLPKFSDCPDPSVFESIQFKPNSDGHIFLLHPEEIAVLGEKAGLSLDSLVICTNFLSAGHVKTAPILKILTPRVIAQTEELARQLPWTLRRKLLCHLAVRFGKPA